MRKTQENALLFTGGRRGVELEGSLESECGFRHFWSSDGPGLIDAVGDLLEFGAVADEAHLVFDEFEHQLCLFGAEMEAGTTPAGFADELAGAEVFKQLDFAACRFVAVERTEVDVLWPIAMQANDTIYGVKAVFVGSPIRLGVGLFDFEMGV